MSHTFAISLTWQYDDESAAPVGANYSRTGELTSVNHAPVTVSAAGGFGGDTSQWNPEELLMGALAQCHMLSFLWVARDEGITVLDYRDEVTGEMHMRGGTGAMIGVTLRPHVVVASRADERRIEGLHARAADMCVIRASVNFPVHCESGVSVR